MNFREFERKMRPLLSCNIVTHTLIPSGAIAAEAAYESHTGNLSCD
ncbi:MAG TPA: hypothetical protein PK669_00360 [Methanosarcina thermophila]|jgi:hypothetical protein|nr:hypothetical protein [Methanosarcina thermophila]NLU57661.1 hypothetical protein [Methanosarcina thermophila]HOA68871.1 hypothetical protein [Methanosarcina thermophila]HOQ64819.1 hypothetical protein [Methanosarcina thermophila]HPT80964.1 hypothetical protein [Methanosarcina thermophila]HPZ18753.1 hypothetical protein [Methanosarcina thermophila]